MYQGKMQLNKQVKNVRDVKSYSECSCFFPFHLKLSWGKENTLFIILTAFHKDTTVSEWSDVIYPGELVFH